MNRKGFTLSELLIVIGIVALLTIMVIPSISKINSNNEKKKYGAYENMLKEYAEAHEVSDTTNLCDIDGLEDVKKLCQGYVRVSGGKYTAYINCPKVGYKTSGYSASIAGDRECS